MKSAAQHPALRKRVVVIFLGTVLLPGLILCYLGLESTREEQYKQKQIYLQNIERLLSLSISQIESEVEDIIRGTMSLIAQPPGSPDKNYFNQIRTLKSQSEMVEHVFFLDMDYRIVYPNTFLSGDMHRRSIVQIDNPHLDWGETLEAQGNVREARAQYHRGLDESTSTVEQLLSLTRIARCELKLGRFHESRQMFLRVIELDGGRFLGREIPYILIAYHHIADITVRLDSRRSAISIMLDNYKLLVDNFHRMTEAQYDFYLTQIKQKIEKAVTDASGDQLDRYRSLQMRETTADQERALHSLILSRLLPEYRNIFSDGQTSTRIRYFRAFSGDDILSIAWKGYIDDFERSGVKALILNDDAFREMLSSTVVLQSVSDDISISMISGDRQPAGPVIGPEDKHLFTAGFSDIQELVPEYRIGIESQTGGIFDMLFMRSLILHYLLLALIVGLILFGILIIFRDISREKEFSRLKSEFISNVSHEIKTPVATLRSLAENLNEGWIRDPKKQEWYFHLMSREAERLSHLVENILDFSRIEAQRKTYRKETVNLGSLLDKVLQRFHFINDGKDITLNSVIAEELPDVLVSPEGIEQAVLNLLDNAAKYSDKEKKIDFCVEQSNGNIVISVTDYGIGIAKNEQQKIFEKFYRVDIKNGEKIPGSGIGLSLAKEIAGIHNGRITVKSEVGVGSTFSLIIPVHSNENNDQDSTH